MAKLERNKEVLTPKADSTGTKALKRSTIEVEKVDAIEDPEKVLQLKKSRSRMIVVFAILDLLLFAVVIYQVVTIFMQIGSAASGTNA
jgi:hypothetical protein